MLVTIAIPKLARKFVMKDEFVNFQTKKGEEAVFYRPKKSGVGLSLGIHSDVTAKYINKMAKLN